MDLTPQERTILERWANETAEARERAHLALKRLTHSNDLAEALLQAYADEESH